MIRRTATGRRPVELPPLGIRVDPFTAAEIIGIVRGAIEQRKRIVVGNHNLHSSYLARADGVFRTACERFDYALVDGFPVLVLASAATGRWLGGRRRVGSMDWVPRLLAGGGVRRLAVVGGSVESNVRAVERVRLLAPEAEVLGRAGEGWDADLADDVAAALRSFQPEVVLVGLGMPRQERFLDEFRDLLPPAVYATVGGAIDQIAGVQQPAPRWLGPVGIEWLWRLATQPRRLAFRYLVEPFLLLRLLLLVRPVRRPSGVEANAPAVARSEMMELQPAEVPPSGDPLSLRAPDLEGSA